MKKLIVLLLILSLCLCGCDVVESYLQGDGHSDSDVATPSVDTSTDQTQNNTTGGNNTAGGNTTAGGDNTAAPPEGEPTVDPDDCTAHVDVNDDGYCDDCFTYVIVVIDLYAVNDLHGKITAGDSQPGIAGLTTYLKSVSNENTILLSSGDMWQGSSESNLTYGALITDWMNEMGFVSMTLGNHEYDWGESYIEINEANAAFPFLAINVYDSETDSRAEYAAPSVVVSRGGVEIGIIGAIGDCYSSISGDVTGGFYFKVGDELTELVRAESERLRAQGVDYIVYSIHDGYGDGFSTPKYLSDEETGYYGAELSDGYVDLVFEAHTHKSYIYYDKEDVYHLQAGGENRGIGHAKVEINQANGNSRLSGYEIIRSSVYSAYAADPLIDELLLKYKDEISSAYEVLGYNAKERSDAAVEQLVADLYYQFGVEKWADEYDIFLGGGFVQTRNPYDLAAGDVTYSDVYSLLPFDNALVLCSVKGSDLKTFVNKGLSTSYNKTYYISYGNNNVNNIDSNKTYYIVVDAYTSTYPYNYLTEVARDDTGTYARDLVAEYIREGGWA